MRSSKISAEILGVREMLLAVEQARKYWTESEVRAAWNAAARSIAVSVRREAPRSKYPVARAGLLRRSIVGQAFKITPWLRYGPGAYAQVTLRRGATNRAPHANIITAGRRALEGSPRLKMTTSRGRVVFPRRVAAVAPNDFWRRGMRAAAPRARQMIIRSLEAAWNRRVGR